MMSAREMFERLGYKLVEVYDPIREEVYANVIQYEKFDGTFYWRITFNTSTKLIHTSCELYGKTIDFTSIYLELLQAINKQVEELGWNNANTTN